MKSRFVLRYRGEGSPPEADVARVAGVAGARVLDATSRMLVVESEPAPLGALVDTLADWVLAPDQAYPVPDTRLKAEPPPSEAPGASPGSLG